MSLVMPSIASESHGQREDRDGQCYDLRHENAARGARSSAIMFSLIETAKENSLDPYRYYTWLLSETPKLAVTDSDVAVSLVHRMLHCGVRRIQLDMISHRGVRLSAL